MRGLSHEERKLLLLTVGSHRSKRPYSPLEVARCFKKAREAGASFKECAEAVHFDGTSMVSRFLRLYALDPEIQHLVDWGQSGSTIAFTAASELSRFNYEDQRQVCQAILERQLSSSEVKQLVQLRLRSRKSIDECINDIIRLRPQVQRRHLFIGAVVPEEVRSQLANLTQAQRDKLLAEVLSQVFPQLTKVAGRLGAERFTIVGDDETASVWTKGDADFESTINSALVDFVGRVSGL